MPGPNHKNNVNYDKTGLKDWELNQIYLSRIKAAEAGFPITQEIMAECLKEMVNIVRNSTNRRDKTGATKVIMGMVKLNMEKDAAAGGSNVLNVAMVRQRLLNDPDGYLEDLRSRALDSDTGDAGEVSERGDLEAGEASFPFRQGLSPCRDREDETPDR